jgi:hypothetical protein
MTSRKSGSAISWGTTLPPVQDDAVFPAGTRKYTYEQRCEFIRKYFEEIHQLKNNKEGERSVPTNSVPTTHSDHDLGMGFNEEHLQNYFPEQEASFPTPQEAKKAGFRQRSKLHSHMALFAEKHHLNYKTFSTWLLNYYRKKPQLKTYSPSKIRKSQILGNANSPVDFPDDPSKSTVGGQVLPFPIPQAISRSITKYCSADKLEIVKDYFAFEREMIRIPGKKLGPAVSSIPPPPPPSASSSSSASEVSYFVYNGFLYEKKKTSSFLLQYSEEKKVNYKTLCKWVSMYQKEGEKAFCSTYNSGLSVKGKKQPHPPLLNNEPLENLYSPPSVVAPPLRLPFTSDLTSSLKKRKDTDFADAADRTEQLRPFHSGGGIVDSILLQEKKKIRFATTPPYEESQEQLFKLIMVEDEGNLLKAEFDRMVGVVKEEIVSCSSPLHCGSAVPYQPSFFVQEDTISDMECEEELKNFDFGGEEDDDDDESDDDGDDVDKQEEDASLLV